ncbi:hypothetical protein A2191_04555 [Candidatus Woesebacteria bacterium RIFOXYA1_FULL_38_9]|nr:MAG: hypothetical protein A2191_04555 [Candidatus Woesebacteria bacterium RIFOXYA1_FULL_38_9]
MARKLPIGLYIFSILIFAVVLANTAYEISDTDLIGAVAVVVALGAAFLVTNLILFVLYSDNQSKIEKHEFNNKEIIRHTQAMLVATNRNTLFILRTAAKELPGTNIVLARIREDEVHHGGIVPVSNGLQLYSEDNIPGGKIQRGDIWVVWNTITQYEPETEIFLSKIGFSVIVHGQDLNQKIAWGYYRT